MPTDVIEVEPFKGGEVPGESDCDHTLHPAGSTAVCSKCGESAIGVKVPDELTTTHELEPGIVVEEVR